MFRIPTLPLAVLALLLPVIALANEGNDRRTTTAETDYSRSYPVSFRAENGGRFQPDRLVILGYKGAWTAPLPRHARNVRQGDHLDLTGVPLIGGVFRPRLAPQDAEKHGLSVGPVTRVGNTLVLDARAHAVELTNLGLALTSELPRLGTMTYEVGVPPYAPAARVPPPGVRVGEAYLVDRQLVLAADGQRPPIRF